MLRIALKTGKVDTVANLAAPEYGDAKFGEQIQQAAKVFAPNDFFGVLPDGTAWVARGHENRVDWRSPDGRGAAGKARDYTKSPVTQADRDRVLAQVREQGKQYGMPQDLADHVPLRRDQAAVRLRPGPPERRGLAPAAPSAGGRALVYDVVNRQGGLAARGGFPAGRVTRRFRRPSGAVYASIKNADGTNGGEVRLQEARVRGY